MNRVYLPRKSARFRQIYLEDRFEHMLTEKFGFSSLDLEGASQSLQVDYLRSCSILIFPSGSAGFTALYCDPKTIIIEISPQTIFYGEVELIDSFFRGGRHIVYVCDGHYGKLSASGDPEQMVINHNRFSQFLTSLVNSNGF